MLVETENELNKHNLKLSKEAIIDNSEGNLLSAHKFSIIVRNIYIAISAESRWQMEQRHFCHAR